MLLQSFPNDWETLSKIIAKATIASPLSNPIVKYRLVIAFNTGWPSPLTPIIEAMTTIANAIIIVWFIPANIVGKARVLNPNNFCALFAPNASAASRTSLSTSLIPKSVNLIMGGIA